MDIFTFLFKKSLVFDDIRENFNNIAYKNLTSILYVNNLIFFKECNTLYTNFRTFGDIFLFSKSFSYPSFS